MTNQATETLIGAVVLAVAGFFLFYAANTAEVSLGGAYPLVAEFRAAEGLSPGSEVRLSGVKVGTVTSVALNPDNYFAVVGLAIEETILLPEDSVAKIASEGLLGGNFVDIDPGGSEFMLEAGALIENTQGSINLLDLVSKAIHGGG